MEEIYLVTGGAGFIGSHLSRRLVKDGKKVRILDNFSTGNRNNISGIEDKIEVISGSITSPRVVDQACEGVSYIFHQAALPSVPRSIKDPLSSHKTNSTGTLHLLIAARKNNVKKFIYAASSSAYGNAAAEYKTEDLPANPLSPYALTKFTGEVYCRLFTNLYGLPTYSLRYFNVFGPRQDPESPYAAVIPKFITAILKGQSPVIYGDGEQSRDFTFVENNIEANILALKSSRGAGEVMNIACGESTTLNQLIEIINRELGTNIKPTYEKERPGDVKHSKAKISKAYQLINYRPQISLEEGLKETIQWYKKLTKKT